MKHLIVFLMTAIFCILSVLVSGQNIDSLSAELEGAVKRDTSLVNLLNTIGQAHIFQNPDSTLFYSKKASDLADSLNYLKGLSKALHFRGCAYSRLSEIDKSLMFLDSCINMARKEKILEYLLPPLIQKGIVISQDRGDYKKGIEIFTEALEISTEINDSIGIGNAMSCMSSNYQSLGYYDLAAEYFFQVLKIAEGRNIPLDLGITYANYSELLKEKGEIDEAIIYANKAKNQFAKIDENLKDYYYEGIDVDLSDLYLEKGEHDKAIECVMNGISAYERIKDPERLSNAYHNAGRIYREAGDFSMALAYLEKAMTQMRENNNLSRQSSIHLDMGRTLLLMNKFNIAEIHLLDGLNIALADSLLENMQTAYNYLAEIHQRKRNFKTAFEMQVKYSEVSENISKQTHSERVDELKIIHDVERVQRESKEKEKENLKQKKIAKIQRHLLFSLFLMLVITFFFVLQTRKRNKALKEASALNRKFQNNVNTIYGEMNSQVTHLVKNETLGKEKLAELSGRLALFKFGFKEALENIKLKLQSNDVNGANSTKKRSIAEINKIVKDYKNIIDTKSELDPILQSSKGLENSLISINQIQQTLSNKQVLGKKEMIGTIILATTFTIVCCYLILYIYKNGWDLAEPITWMVDSVFKIFEYLLTIWLLYIGIKFFRKST